MPQALVVPFAKQSLSTIRCLRGPVLTYSAPVSSVCVILLTLLFLVAFVWRCAVGCLQVIRRTGLHCARPATCSNDGLLMQIETCPEVYQVTTYDGAAKLALAMCNLHRVCAALLRHAPPRAQRVALNTPMRREWVSMQCCLQPTKTA